MKIKITHRNVDLVGTDVVGATRVSTDSFVTTGSRTPQEFETFGDICKQDQENEKPVGFRDGPKKEERKRR